MKIISDISLLFSNIFKHFLSPLQMTVVFSPLAVLSVIIFLSFGWWMNPLDGRLVLDSLYYHTNATYRQEALSTNYSSTRVSLP